MSKIEEIEKAVQALSESELARFRAWFTEFDQDQWDQQLEADVSSGKLDGLMNEALRDLNEGRIRPL